MIIKDDNDVKVAHTRAVLEQQVEDLALAGLNLLNVVEHFLPVPEEDIAPEFADEFRVVTAAKSAMTQALSRL